jgi:hypothetical protein
MLKETSEVVCDKAFRQEVREACYAALIRAGFKRYRKNGIDRDLGNGFRCWIGLNTALFSSHVEINPFVGLHVVPLEKLWTSLKSGKYPGKYDRGVATISVHLGVLRPDEKAFCFERRTNLDVEANRLAKLYEDVGMSFAREIASYEALLPLLQQRVELLGGFPERFACCLYIMGRREEAREFVPEFCSAHRDYFEGFADPFLRENEQKSD